MAINKVEIQFLDYGDYNKTITDKGTLSVKKINDKSFKAIFMNCKLFISKDVFGFENMDYDKVEIGTDLNNLITVYNARFSQKGVEIENQFIQPSGSMTGKSCEMLWYIKLSDSKRTGRVSYNKVKSLFVTNSQLDLTDNYLNLVNNDKNEWDRLKENIDRETLENTIVENNLKTLVNFQHNQDPSAHLNKKLNIYRSNKTDGKFLTTIYTSKISGVEKEVYRSEISGIGNTIRTETIITYSEFGVILMTIINTYTLTYDEDGDIIQEVSN